MQPNYPKLDKRKTRKSFSRAQELGTKLKTIRQHPCIQKCMSPNLVNTRIRLLETGNFKGYKKAQSPQRNVMSTYKCLVGCKSFPNIRLQ